MGGFCLQIEAWEEVPWSGTHSSERPPPSGPGLTGKHCPRPSCPGAEPPAGAQSEISALILLGAPSWQQEASQEPSPIVTLHRSAAGLENLSCARCSGRGVCIHRIPVHSRPHHPHVVDDEAETQRSYLTDPNTHRGHPDVRNQFSHVSTFFLTKENQQ